MTTTEEDSWNRTARDENMFRWEMNKEKKRKKKKKKKSHTRTHARTHACTHTEEREKRVIQASLNIELKF